MTSRPTPIQIPPSLLLLILDLHPLSWSLLSSPPPQHETDPMVLPVISKAQISALSLTEFIQLLMVFLKAHLAGRWGNGVVVYGASAGRAKLLYPPPESADEPPQPSSNTFQPFRHLDKHLESSIKAMMAEEEELFAASEGKGLNESPAIVSALTKALCYINRQTPPPQSVSSLTSQPNLSDPNNPSGTSNEGMTEKIETRIMVVNATPGGPAVSLQSNEEDGAGVTKGNVGGGKTLGQGRGGYVGLMNCVFAAQKGKIPIDILTLPPSYTKTSDPIFLQQASYLTGGIYWRWNGRGGLLQYLHGIYLPPPSLRLRPFSNPPQDAVDFRAVCFCHQEVVDVGFVCSVCLSIFCKPLPVCLMCKTKFPIKSLPALKALAAGIQPIPLPDTNVYPSLPRVSVGGGTHTNRADRNGGGGGEVGKGKGGRREDAIVID